MKRFFLVPALLVLATPALAGDVGVSVSVDRPGFYGSIDIGDFRPRTVNVQPIIVQPVVGVVAQPIYMHVPPGHAKKWSRHCHQYQACGRPVYFVQEEWYEREYKPRKHGKHSARGGKGDSGGKGNGKGRHD
ncbi:MAG: hypothetical protein V4729_08800 [Pseudomonadota bacterium]